MMRDSILVEENGSIVKFVRQKTPTKTPNRLHLPKQQTTKNRKTSNTRSARPTRSIRNTKQQPTVGNSKASSSIQTADQLRQCRIVVHNMSKEEINAAIISVENKNKDIDDLANLFACDWLGEQRKPQPKPSNNQMTRDKFELDLEWINNSDTFKIVIGNSTFFFTPAAMTSYLSGLLSNLTIGSQNVDANNMAAKDVEVMKLPIDRENDCRGFYDSIEVSANISLNCLANLF